MAFLTPQDDPFGASKHPKVRFGTFDINAEYFALSVKSEIYFIDAETVENYSVVTPKIIEMGSGEGVSIN